LPFSFFADHVATPNYTSFITFSRHKFLLVKILKGPKGQGIISIRMLATFLKSQATETLFIKILSDIT